MNRTDPTPEVKAYQLSDCTYGTVKIKPKRNDCRFCKHEKGTQCTHPNEGKKWFYSAPESACFEKKKYRNIH